MKNSCLQTLTNGQNSLRELRELRVIVEQFNLERIPSKFLWEILGRSLENKNW